MYGGGAGNVGKAKTRSSPAFKLHRSDMRTPQRVAPVAIAREAATGPACLGGSCASHPWRAPETNVDSLVLKFKDGTNGNDGKTQQSYPRTRQDCMACCTLHRSSCSTDTHAQSFLHTKVLSIDSQSEQMYLHHQTNYKVVQLHTSSASQQPSKSPPLLSLNRPPFNQPPLEPNAACPSRRLDFHFQLRPDGLGAVVTHRECPQ